MIRLLIVNNERRKKPSSRESNPIVPRKGLIVLISCSLYSIGLLFETPFPLMLEEGLGFGFYY